MEKPGPSPEQADQKQSLSEHYDEIYSEGHGAFGREPTPVVAELAGMLPKGARVYEVAAGQGRNALYLAQQGYEVKATDLSQVGIDQITKTAQSEGLSNITAEVGDVRDGIKGEYDAVAITFALHHLPKAEAEQVISDMKEHTKPGGFNVVAAFTDNGDVGRKDAIGGRFAPSIEEMKNYYSDWEIVKTRVDESHLRAKKPDGSPMVNEAISLVAMRPL